MQIGRRQLDLHPAAVLMPPVQRLEHREEIVERELEPVVPPLHRPAQLRRQAGNEVRVRLIHQPVLIAHRERIRHPHPDILVRADHVLAPCLHFTQLARRPAMQMLHRGDPRRDHLERRIQRIEIRVDVPHHHARDEPQLQRHVRRAKLHRRQPDMVMPIDEARQQHLLARADHRYGRMPPRQVGERADSSDGSVLLQDRAVGDFLPPMAIQRAGDHRAAANQ